MKRTSKKDASLAGRLLHDPEADVRSVAGSDLSQRAEADRRTSVKEASLASKLLHDPASTSAEKSVAASDLSQREP